MERWQVLTRCGAALGLLAGCTSPSDAPPESPTMASTATTTVREAPTPSPTPRERPQTIFVDGKNGDPEGDGSGSEPVDSIQRGVERAHPGETVQVRPGEYREHVRPPRGGAPGAPITLTGPPDAVLKSEAQSSKIMALRHSHIHVTGLTLDGLEQPDAPDRVNSYTEGALVQVKPPTSTDAYLEDIVIAPDGIGNSQSALVNLQRTQNVDVGPFRVIGPAGTKYLYSDRKGHNGEVVYVGTSPSNLGKRWHPWTTYDETNGVLVHHIDNSDGHRHSELVNTKLGTHDITVQYCTDGGGSWNSTPNDAASIRLQGSDATVRWCDLRNGAGHGIEIASATARDAHQGTATPSAIERRGGTDNSVYRNRIIGFDDKAIAFPFDSQSEAHQRVVCNNEYDGRTDGHPDSDCGADLPNGDGIGHTGGDSPD